MPYLAGNHKLTPLSPFGYVIDRDILDRSGSLGVWPPTFGPLPPDAIGVPRGDETYALPLVGNVMMLWYRADVIQEPDTIDNLLQEFANPDPAYVGAAGLAPSNNPHVYLSWLASRGSDVFDRSWRTTTLRSAIAMDAFVEYIREASRLRVPYEEFAGERYEPHARMLDGTASAAVAWAADAQLLLTSAVSDQIRVTQFPTGRKSSTVTGNWLLAIPTDAANPETAFDFLTWATSPQIQKTSALLGVPPVRSSLFTDRELITRYPWLPDVATALNHGYARPRIPAWDVVEGVLSCALDRSFTRLAGLDPAAPANAIAFASIPREELVRAARDIEGVMEEWGYYRGADYWSNVRTESIAGDPRDEWTCVAVVTP
ncbi:MAG: extracellular solute-binding protein [Chloroflexi bacterium]|nr:extracellular solute-binding protein [Chloroflexota bacterium]